MLAKMSRAFDHAHMYRVATAISAGPAWAMDLMSPVNTTHWSSAKATTFKPTVIYSARQHANEVSVYESCASPRGATADRFCQRKKLAKVNVVIHPFTNPDGAQLAYDLYRVTPDYILHAGYLGSLGMDATAGGGQDFPVYPESKVRNQLLGALATGYLSEPARVSKPSGRSVVLGVSRSWCVGGRVTERNWGFNKGWFMPGFGYVDRPCISQAQGRRVQIREYITAGINSNRDVFDLNQRAYARYRRYGADFDPRRLPPPHDRQAY